MKDVASVEVIRPESQHYCSILNGAFYVYCVFQEWSDDFVSFKLSNFFYSNKY